MPSSRTVTSARPPDDMIHVPKLPTAIAVNSHTPYCQGCDGNDSSDPFPNGTSIVGPDFSTIPSPNTVAMPKPMIQSMGLTRRLDSPGSNGSIQRSKTVMVRLSLQCGLGRGGRDRPAPRAKSLV